MSDTHRLTAHSSRAAHGMLLLLGVLASAAAPAETLLVVRKTDNAVTFVDPGSGVALATVQTGFAPHEISVAPDGRRAVVSNYGTRDQPGASVSIIDLAQPREIRRIALAPHTRPHGVAWYAQDRIAVTTEGSQSLLVVDPDAGRVVQAIGTAQAASHMVAVSADAARAYVTNIGSGTTTVIDLAAGRKVTDLATGAGSEALALSPDGRELWVAARAAAEIVVVDTGTLEITARLPAPGMPIRIAFAADGRIALVTCAQSSELAAFDRLRRTALGRRKIDVVPAPGAGQRPFAQLAPGSALPVGLLWSRDGRTAYVAATMGDRVLRVNGTSLEVLGTIEIGGEPDGLALTEVLPEAPCHGCKPLPGEEPSPALTRDRSR
jgi:DNA-binding beta-propeller fold protein YncE